MMPNIETDNNPSEQILRDIIDKKPTYDAYIKLGDFLINTGNTVEAIKCFSAARRIKPNDALIYIRLGDAHISLYSELAFLAPAFYRKSLELDDNNANTFNKLGLALHSLGQQEEAIDCFKKAFSIKPDFVRARFNHCIAQIPILYQKEEEILRSRARYRQELENLQGSITLDSQSEREEAAKEHLRPFYLPYQGHNDCELQRTYGEVMSRIQMARYPQFNRAPTFTPIKPGEQIRVGFVSSQFYNHANWHAIIKGWICNLNRARYRLFGYHAGHQKDGHTEVARQSFSFFVENIYSLEKLARIIRNDRLHILIYPEIGMNIMAGNLAALRLAPIQCTSWGQPFTSGLPTMDYFLGSELMEPPGAESHYTERLVRLPNLSIHYTPPDVPEIHGDRAGLGLPAASVLFLCAQALWKYLPQYDEVFPRIVKDLGKCHFVFKKHYQSPQITHQFQQRLSQAFAHYGLDSEDYVTLLPNLEDAHYYALYRLVDIFLDSIGYSGFTTTQNAISCDLPVVTVPGKFMRGRQSYAILTMMGVTETIGATVDDYVSLAVRLGADRNWRQQLTQKIAGNKWKLYRDMTCIRGLEAFIEEAVSRRLRLSSIRRNSG
ncbi:MAG: tetratricopeptide repeat protein [Desulfobaccales bacterium]